MKNKYDILIALKKSLKNTLVVLILPAIVFLSNNYAEWLPKEYWPVAALVAGFIGYMVKNWVENK